MEPGGPEGEDELQELYRPSRHVLFALGCVLVALVGMMRGPLDDRLSTGWRRSKGDAEDRALRREFELLGLRIERGEVGGGEAP